MLNFLISFYIIWKVAYAIFCGTQNRRNLSDLDVIKILML